MCEDKVCEEGEGEKVCEEGEGEKVCEEGEGEKSCEDMASSRNLDSKIEHKQVPKRKTEPGVRKGKRSLLACNTNCKCSMETSHNSVRVKLGIKVMKLVDGLIG